MKSSPAAGPIYNIQVMGPGPCPSGSLLQAAEGGKDAVSRSDLTLGHPIHSCGATA